MAESSLAKLPAIAKVGICAGLLLLVGMAYFIVFYGDIAGRITNAKKAETQLHSDLDKARKDEFAYQKDLAELRDRELRDGEQQEELPTKTEYPAFLSAIQNVANVSGIDLSAWTPQEEVPDKFYSRVPMRLELRGRYHQIAKFFYGVGQLKRIINMEDISITDPKPVGEDVTLRAQALATAFRAKGAGPAKPRPGAPPPPAPPKPGGAK